jgi:hypothetical protein
VPFRLPQILSIKQRLREIALQVAVPMTSPVAALICMTVLGLYPRCWIPSEGRCWEGFDVVSETSAWHRDFHRGAAARLVLNVLPSWQKSRTGPCGGGAGELAPAAALIFIRDCRCRRYRQPFAPHQSKVKDRSG